MKNIHQKGASPVIIIIAVLIVVAIGLYFYTADRSDDAREGGMIEDESSEVNEVNDTDESVGFEENPVNLPATEAPATAPASASIDIANFAFSPATITVKAGTTITWTNKDSAPHTVTAADGSFDSGNMAKSQSYSKKFDTAGSYAYVCAYHPNMKATVIVTQ